jgi:hypothetical protein
VGTVVKKRDQVTKESPFAEKVTTAAAFKGNVGGVLILEINLTPF